MQNDTPVMSMPLNNWLLLLSVALGGKLDAVDGELVLRTEFAPHGISIAELPDAFEELDARMLINVREPRPVITNSGAWFLIRWVNRDLRWSPDYRNLVANLKKVKTAEELDYEEQQTRKAA